MNAKNSFPISLLAGTAKCQTRIVLVVTAKRELKAVQNETFFKLWALMGGGQLKPGFCQNGNNWCLSKGKRGKLFHLLKMFFGSVKNLKFKTS